MIVVTESPVCEVYLPQDFQLSTLDISEQQTIHQKLSNS